MVRSVFGGRVGRRAPRCPLPLAAPGRARSAARVTSTRGDQASERTAGEHVDHATQSEIRTEVLHATRARRALPGSPMYRNPPRSEGTRPTIMIWPTFHALGSACGTTVAMRHGSPADRRTPMTTEPTILLLDAEPMLREV